MFHRIVVPLDGSTRSEAVLPYVARLLTNGCDATVLWVVRPGSARAGAGERSSSEERRRGEGEAAPRARRRFWERRREAPAVVRERLDRAASRLSRTGCRAEVRVVEGDPAERIAAVAEEVGATLVAMTTHGRSGVRRLIRGSVAERVLRVSRAPVFLLNPHSVTEEPGRIRRILVPLDGSEVGDRILPLVISVARDHRASARLVYVAGFGEEQRAPEAILGPQWIELSSHGVETEVQTRTGLPHVEIVRAAEELSADLVAMSTHGRTGAQRWVYGSVADNVLRHCRRPLLVQRTVPAERREAPPRVPTGA